MRVKEYKTIGSCDTENLDDSVNVYLDEGWELFGSPYCEFGDDFQMFYQAMVREA